MVCNADTVIVRVAHLNMWQEVLSSLQKATTDVKVWILYYFQFHNWNDHSPAVAINIRLEALLRGYLQKELTNGPQPLNDYSRGPMRCD